MSAKEMFKELGYIQDEEPRNGTLISFTKYCKDGGCRINDLKFKEDKKIYIEEGVIDIKFLQAINEQVEELGWLD